MLSCTHAGCTFVAKYACLLKRHECRHTGERLFPCPLPGCGHRLASSSALTQHTQAHEAVEAVKGRGIACGEEGCTYIATSPAALVRHAKHAKHIGLVCPVPLCGLRFSSMASLSVHRTRHKREGDGLVCKQCNAVIVGGEEYMKHVYAHKAERMREGRQAAQQKRINAESC